MTGDRPISAAAARVFQETVAFLRDHVLADPRARESPLIASTASQLLAAVVLNTVPHTGLTDPSAGDRRNAQVVAVRRAVAYIETHPREPITPSDIAAARTSIWGVREAFRRQRGISPMQYLQPVRLDGAHHDLRAAEPGAAETMITVAAIATRWGFCSLSRFIRLYHQHYHTLPGYAART